ncbi:MAG: NAD-dependent dehydratase [Armatimonadetes bacterium CG_4_10_14_3_um_filter_66_18]|nr:SDR family NAD(P)-dependent oxidoreductase [Armatimonadota bacterium]OIP01439.1 MAG: NAD-dependent dehydratase [Armatimonadetes bacterium CG2_30_66_41]PIU87609.1 MAG: NAD-dependent dehydratase [Armatimonadetes bacterium CG06_land_8_20_14_3_00_66_21]PIY52294.1 MAG: NAD-dependent dehydratase [Armatimonadetes bacterium CG_4_10_14_3_um_filter_66_18]PJB75549.1 MAG: NAD-dependent dehydratase [Armatimonadetes bacterium CG_4_9_14_3_um_filter_66_14]
MSVLVTGAGGFIGSHVVEATVRDGHQVRALVRYNSRGSSGFLDDLDAEIRESVEVVFGDLRDEESVAKAAEGVDAILHLGALIAIPYSYEAPRATIETNVIGTTNVLSAARRLGVRRVVHTSTSEVYGTALYAPIDEKHPLQGQSPYSASKIAADKIVESYHRSFGIPTVTIRPFNTFGPRQSARAVIPTIISQLLKGPQVRLGALHPTRDLTFVEDTAWAFVLAAQAQGVDGEEINLGTGQEISIGDLATKIAALMEREIEIVSDDQRQRPAKSEVERLIADNSKAKRLLAWEPQVGLDEGVRRTVRWIEAHRDLYRPGEYQR